MRGLMARQSAEPLKLFLAFCCSKIVLLMVVVASVVACKKTHDADVAYRPGSIEKTSKNFLIPRDLKVEIEKEYLKFIRKENPKVVLPDDEILVRIPREFLDIEFTFRSSAPGVLVDHTSFSLPRGGGEIDLKDYVIGKKGSFFLKMNAKRSNDPKHEEVSDFHVYFLSETRERKIGGETFGAGCKRFMDITDVVSKSEAKGGLHLNATDQRYLSVVGGVFYIVNFNPERKIYIAAVRVTDSRYPQLLCDGEYGLGT